MVFPLTGAVFRGKLPPSSDKMVPTALHPTCAVFRGKLPCLVTKCPPHLCYFPWQTAPIQWQNGAHPTPPHLCCFPWQTAPIQWQNAPYTCAVFHGKLPLSSDKMVPTPLVLFSVANCPYPVTKCPPHLCCFSRKLPPPSDKMAQPSKLWAILSLTGAFCLLDGLSESKWRRRQKNSMAIEFLCRERQFASGHCFTPTPAVVQYVRRINHQYQFNVVLNSLLNTFELGWNSEHHKK